MSMSKQSRRTIRISMTLMLVGALLGGGLSASAYWSSESTHTGSAVAGVDLPAPATMGCTTSGLPIVLQTATVRWSKVDGASGYQVTVTRDTGGAAYSAYYADNGAADDRKIALTTGVLGDLLSGLLNPAILTVTVAPAYRASGGTWTSPHVKSYQANAVLLPIGTTCRGPA